MESIGGIKSYALSNDDINEILEPNTKVIRYTDLNDMSSIDEAFDDLGRCIILYLTEDNNTGHWCCMWKTNPDTIFYFDSYGEKPDEPLTWLNRSHRAELGIEDGRLTQMLRASGYKVYYSPVQYQVDRGAVNTCGRWCVVRLVLKDESPKTFNQIVKKSGMSGDNFVSVFTAKMLGK